MKQILSLEDAKLEYKKLEHANWNMRFGIHKLKQDITHHWHSILRQNGTYILIQSTDEHLFPVQRFDDFYDCIVIGNEFEGGIMMREITVENVPNEECRLLFNTPTPQCDETTGKRPFDLMRLSTDLNFMDNKPYLDLFSKQRPNLNLIMEKFENPIHFFNAMLNRQYNKTTIVFPRQQQEQIDDDEEIPKIVRTCWVELYAYHPHVGLVNYISK